VTNAEKIARPVLLAVDIQNDFVPGGALPVPGGDKIVPLINRLGGLFPVAVATRDWHPPGHGSFYTRHPGKEPYQMGELGGRPQMMWPEHCVQGTWGAEFAPGLETGIFRKHFFKGRDPEVDSYSAFYDNNHAHPTGLGAYLVSLETDGLFIGGLAYDYCVFYSSLDALEFVPSVYVVEDACRAVSPVTAASARETMVEKGVRLVRSGDLPEILGLRSRRG